MSDTLSKDILTQAKTLLDSKKNLRQIITELNLEVAPPELRMSLVQEYGREVIVKQLQDLRSTQTIPDFSLLSKRIKNNIAKNNNITIEQCDKMIENLNAAITEVIRIKSDIDVTP